MKNKKVLIFTVIAIIFFAAIGIGIAYVTTDMFKTEQQLFYKYIARTKILETNFVEDYNNVSDKITKNSNSSSANLEVLKSIINATTGVADIEKILTVNSNGLKNTISNQDYRDFTFSSNEQNILTLKYIRDNNIYGISIENILAKYLAVENANLKDLFAKLGVEDTTNVPDSLPTNYEEIIKIDEVTLNQLKETYGTLIYNNINEECFYKVTNEDGTQTIGVSLSEQEVTNVLKIMLETAKNDNTLLNLIVSKAQLLNNNNITIENIQTTIQQYIEEIVSGNYSAEKDFVRVSLIKNNNNIIRIIFETNQNLNKSDMTDSNDVAFKEVSPKNNNKIEIDLLDMKKFTISMKENDIELIRTDIDYEYNNDIISLNINTEVKENQEVSNTTRIQYQISNYQTDNISEKVVVDITSKEESYQINYTNNIILKQDVQISKLTTENSAKINDMTSEQIEQVFTTLGEKISSLLYQKPETNLYNSNTQSALEKMEQKQIEEKELLQNAENYLESIEKIN